MYNYYNGISSILFTISAIKSIFVSKLILWKCSNIILPITSFLYNIDYNNKYYEFADYFTIYFICASYINHFTINSILSILLVYEFINSYNIIVVKNITFCLSILKSIINTYYYDINLVIVLLPHIIIYMLLFKVRQELYYRNIMDYITILTIAGHICILHILYITSFTS